jgi:hypothetical protein
MLLYDHIPPCRGARIWCAHKRVWLVVGWSESYGASRHDNDNCLILGLREQAMRDAYRRMIEIFRRDMMEDIQASNRTGPIKAGSPSGALYPSSASRQLPSPHHIIEPDDIGVVRAGAFSSPSPAQVGEAAPVVSPTPYPPTTGACTFPPDEART